MNYRWSKLYIIFSFITFSVYPQIDTSEYSLSAFSVLGTEDLIPVIDTSEIKIITASRTSKKLSDLPVTIHVITHEEIQTKQYTSLTDVLKMMPGMRVSQPGSGETGDYFEVRGLTGNFYTKILLNGVPIKPSVLKGMPIGSQLPVRQAERIEVIYGPAAAIYGADAIAGVVNIITKKSEQGTFARADISLGQNEYSYFNFTIGGKAGKNNNILKYNFYGNKTGFIDQNIKYDIEKYYNPLYSFDSFYIQSINYSASDIINKKINVPNEEEFIAENFGPQYEGSLFKPVMAELPASSYSVGIDLDFRGVKIAYNNMYRSMHSSIGHNTAQYKYNNPQNYWGDYIQITSLSYEKIWSKFSTFTQISNQNYTMDNNSSFGLTFLHNTDKVYRYAASNDILFEQLITFVPAENIEVTSGLSYQKSTYLPITNYLSVPFNQEEYKPSSKTVAFKDSLFCHSLYYPGVSRNASGFSQVFIVKNKFRFMGGLRYDYNSRYGSQFSPRIGALYKYSNKSVVRLTGGLAYKSPPPSLQYENISYPINHIDSVYYKRIPALSLKPEKFQSIEFGLNTTPFWNVKVDLAIYYNNIYNQFNNTFKASTYNCKYAINDSAYTIKNSDFFWRVYGVQSNFKKNNIISSIKMDAELNLMYSYYTQNLPNLDTLLGNIKLLPRHFGQLTLSFYPVKNLYICIENLWESNWLRNIIFFENVYDYLFKDNTGYFTLNTLINYNVSNNLKCFIKITNLLNEKYNGLNDTGQTIDQLYNPQFGRNIRIGLSYSLN